MIIIIIKIMKDSRRYDAEFLEKNLLSTRYSVIDEMANLKESMYKEQSLIKANRQKAEQLQRKILMLEAAQNKSKSMANRYRKKLSKLETSQQMMLSLHRLKEDEMMKRQSELELKKKKCEKMRSNLSEQKRKSFDIFQRRKSVRVKNMKKEDFSALMQKQRRSEADMTSRVNRKTMIRDQELSARDRLNRYQQFKVAQAQFNYELKKQEQVAKHAQKLRQLQELTIKVRQEKQIFRKTQVMSKEANRIESFYLTNH